jgi:Uma2 family endonuclease
MATTARATEADLLAMPRDGQKYELVGGEIRMSPAGFRHGQVCVKLILRLGAFVEERRLGFVVDSSTGFRMPTGNVRLPDVAFVAAGRLEGGAAPDGFCPVPPDLAAEVLSPSDRPQHILDKVGEYLESGVRLVWVIDPAAGRAVVHRSASDARTLGRDDALDGEDVVPGFHCLVRELL